MHFLIYDIEIAVPKLLLLALFLLGFLHELICSLFRYLGLAIFIEPDVVAAYSAVQRPNSKPLTAMLIKENLPVVRFQELGVDHEMPNGCAICLDEFKGREEIRPLALCQHIFHRKCLDHWIDHDQKTCPLCRTPLIDTEMVKQPAFDL